MAKNIWYEKNKKDKEMIKIKKKKYREQNIEKFLDIYLYIFYDKRKYQLKRITLLRNLPFYKIDNSFE